MRPQLNISLDEYPELPEKIKKFCKVKGYKISDFCARVLDAEIQKEVGEFSGDNSESLEDRMSRLETEMQELRDEIRSQALRSDHADLVNKKNDNTLSNLRCEACGQVGGHRLAGIDRHQRQLYYCGNPAHTTKTGGRHRSHKFVVLE